MVSSLRVDASDGTVYPGVGTRVDLTGADPSRTGLEYRMVATVRVQGGAVKTYASAWSPVSFAAPIDSLSWSVNDDRTEMSINVSTHTDGKQGYHRWLAEETWEYRAEYYALYFYARKGTIYRGVELPKDSVYRYEGGDNTYYCWNSAQRPEVMAASTTDLSEDRLVNHRLYTLGNKERKISYLYS